MTGDDGPELWFAEELVLLSEESDELDRISDTLGTAEVVGMGESTHGTREFVRLRHRLLQHLVTECGVRAVGIEAAFSETLPLSAYVFDGRGDPREALFEISYWVYRVESVLEAVEWLRSFNDGRPPEDRVRLYGIDVGSERATDAAATQLRETLSAALPDTARRHDEVLEMLATGGLLIDDEATFRRRLARTWRLTSQLREQLHDRRDTVERTTSERRWRLAVRQVRTLRQAANVVEAAREPDRAALRDYYMAENVSWLRDCADTTPVVVWGHNGHIADTDRPSVGRSMGHYLRTTHGDDYYAVLFECGSGRFAAVPPSGGGLETFTLADPGSGTLADTLQTLGHDQFLLDLRGLASPEPLDEPRHVRQIGSGFDPNWEPAQYHTALVPTDAADGVVYIDTGSPVSYLDDHRPGDKSASDK